MISRLAASLSQNQTYAKVKLQLLCILFNSLEQFSPFRVTVYLHMLRLASAAKQSSVLVGEFPRIDSWVGSWQMSDQSKAEIYLLMSQASTETNSPILSQYYLLKYLKTFESADAGRLAEALPHAVTAALYTINDPSVHQCDPLLELNAIKQLQTSTASPSHQDVYKLLDIFALRSVVEFNSFLSESKTSLTDLKIDPDEALAKMRRLTLMSLVADKDTLPYADVAAALALSGDDEVEEAVIDAAGHKCLDVKLDQERLLVIIRRVDQRQFVGDEASWAALEVQLSRWATNIDKVLVALPGGEGEPQEQ